jgi:hypothetical protein
MVVLSAAVMTKPGKVLVARQFVPMTRIRIEGLLAAFPKLIGDDTQHTFAETDAVRYLYSPLDQLYLVIITNKQSNIMEDMATMLLLAKVVPEFCHGHRESDVVEHVFELVCAFDEVINCGIKENVTLEQIKTFTEMDSHEEMVQKLIEESKVNEAKERARERAQLIDKQKQFQKQQQANTYKPSSYGGGGSAEHNYGGGSGSTEAYVPHEPAPVKKEPPKEAAKPAGKGMALKGAKKKEDFFRAVAQEEKLSGPSTPQVTIHTGDGTITPEMQNKVLITVNEKLTLVSVREEIQKFFVDGEMKLTVFDPDDAKVKIKLAAPLDQSVYKCRLHPKFDQKAFDASGVLEFKDATSTFPVGSSNAPILFRWRSIGPCMPANLVPFKLDLWPQPEDKRSVVTVTFTHVKQGHTFNDVIVTIPCASSEPPSITSSQDSEYHYDHKQKALVWRIAEVSDTISTGTLEFNVPEVDEDAFYPLNVQFSSTQTFAGPHVAAVTHVDSGATHEFNFSTRLSQEVFQIIES